MREGRGGREGRSFGAVCVEGDHGGCGVGSLFMVGWGGGGRVRGVCGFELMEFGMEKYCRSYLMVVI